MSLVMILQVGLSILLLDMFPCMKNLKRRWEQSKKHERGSSLRPKDRGCGSVVIAEMKDLLVTGRIMTVELMVLKHKAESGCLKSIAVDNYNQSEGPRLADCASGTRSRQS